MEHTDILEEIILPERAGVLGSKSYQNVDGKILKVTRLVFCDNCKCRTSDDNNQLALCIVCGKKLCSSSQCRFELRGKQYCPDHIQQVLPLSVHGFEILHCALAEVDVREVCEFAGITDDAYKAALNELLEAGYIEKRGISFLARHSALDKGLLAWTTYFGAYAGQGDVAYFFRKLSEHSRK